MSKHGHKRQNNLRVHVNKYATYSKAESVAAGLDAELKRASKIVGKEQRASVPYSWRVQTPRFEGDYNNHQLDYLGEGRMNQPKPPQREIRRATDFWLSL